MDSVPTAITVDNPDPSILRHNITGSNDQFQLVLLTGFSRSKHIYVYLVKYVETITCFDKCIFGITVIFSQR